MAPSPSPLGCRRDCFLPGLGVGAGRDAERWLQPGGVWTGQKTLRCSFTPRFTPSAFHRSARKPRTERDDSTVTFDQTRGSHEPASAAGKPPCPPPHSSPASMYSDSAKIPLCRPATCCCEPSYTRPFLQKCAKRNKSAMVFGSPPSEPGTAAARRKLCFGGKLVSWHVISRGEFLIRDLVETCQSPSCYRFSILSLAAPLRPSPPHVSSLWLGSSYEKEKEQQV